MASKRSASVRGNGARNVSRKRQGFFHKAKTKVVDSAKSIRDHQALLVNTFRTMSFTTKIVVSLIVMTVAVTALVSLTKSQLTVNEKQRTLDELDRKIAQQKLDNKELEDKLNGDLDQYIEAYAREKLDMVKPGERVYINTVGD